MKIQPQRQCNTVMSCFQYTSGHQSRELNCKFQYFSHDQRMYWASKSILWAKSCTCHYLVNSENILGWPDVCSMLALVLNRETDQPNHIFETDPSQPAKPAHNF